MPNANDEGGADEDLDLEDLPEEEIGDDGKPKEGSDTIDWKAEALKRQGIAKRFKTKLEKQAINSKVEKKVEKTLQEKKSEGLDRIDKLFLRSEKITDTKEVELVESIMKETGKSLEAVLDSKYFQAELKEMRDLKATEDATPSGQKRSGTSTRDTVDYWIAKGELPPTTEPALRQKVVNAKIAKEHAGSQFSSNPIQ